MSTAPPANRSAASTFVPVRLGMGPASLDVALLCKRDAPAREALVPLRQTPLGIAYLACLLDGAGTNHGWLELWVQRFDNTGSASARSDGNESRDRAFGEWQAALASVDPAAIIVLHDQSRPLALDIASGFGRSRVEGGWTLCRDDAALRAAGLASYSDGTLRYLSRTADGQRAFIALSDDAPIDASAQSLTEVARLPTDQIPFNTECGGVFATRWLPASLEEHLGLIEGESWTPPLHGRAPVPTDAVAVAIRQQDSTGTGSLFLVNRSREQRLAEALHLKLLALRAAVNTVARATRATGRPLLSVHLDSFRVGYALTGDFTPVLWFAHLHLVTPSTASELPGGSGGNRMFASSDATRGSVFAADAANAPRSGKLNVRIRQTTPERGLGHIVEATLSSVEPIAVAAGDDLWLSVLTTAGAVPLLGSVEPSGDRTLRFRSRAAPLTDAQAAWFEQSAGVALRDVPFELLRTRGSPCDLYSLGVLGLRCLFGGAGAPSLGVVIDEVVALAQADDALGDELAASISKKLAADVARREHLGPRFILREAVAADDAFDLIPPSLWAAALACLTRMLSGTSPNSTCPDLVGNGGDPGVFDRALSELSALIVQTRSLVLNELHYNRRVASVVDAMMNERAKR